MASIANDIAVSSSAALAATPADFGGMAKQRKNTWSFVAGPSDARRQGF